MDAPRDLSTSTAARLWSRRELFAQLARGAAVATVAPALFELVTRHALAQVDGSAKKSKKLILIWLEGGPSQIDTFDPKPGAATNGPFAALPTDVKGWSMSEHLPLLAKRAQHLALVRSMTSKEGSHARARDLLHCGYRPNPSVPFPTLGSIVAHEVGDLDGDLPAFVQIGGLPAGGGYLGLASAPFVIDDPNGKVENVAYRRGVDAARTDRREELRTLLDDEFAADGGARAVQANEVQRKRARRMMDSKLLVAFDTKSEKEELAAAYGHSPFGRGLLLARRLLEHGVAAVEVVLPGWDTHVDNFTRTRELCRVLDPGFATLLDDLRERSLFDDTLVVCMGEFGRTPTINPAKGRDHWPDNYCVVLAGGGVKGGTVVGETDERCEKIASRPVQVADLFATIAATLGIDGSKEFQATTRRPVKLVDPEGKVVAELLA